MQSACTSSLNRNNEWKRCCADAMGFEWVDSFADDVDFNNDNDARKENNEDFEGSRNEPEENIHLTNLLEYKFHDSEDEGCFEKRYDAWLKNALRIQADLMQMSQWIQAKKEEYVGMYMKDEEAALIQSTVTSFAATTASELETLRNMILSTSHGEGISGNNDLSNHRSGIVQILLVQLQEYVTKPFNVCQKQRVRLAVQLWQNPLQCKLYDTSKLQSKDSLFDDNGEDEYQGCKPLEQRFMPTKSYKECNKNNVGAEFITKYSNKRITSIPSTLPAFLSESSKLQCKKRIENKSSRSLPTSSLQTMSFENVASFPASVDIDVGTQESPQPFQPAIREMQEKQKEKARKNSEDYQHQLEDDLRTETAQLTTTLIASNDLDDVKQMETRMVEITTLIGQFSNLVQEQQEQVLQVHESAKETKDNLEKGKDNLLDAAERTNNSKHFKAWLIMGMAATLMFFQILRD